MRHKTVGSLAFILASAGLVHAGDPIFNSAILHETRIVIDPADWQALRDNFRSNQYYAANISLDNEVIQQVGIRSRGKGSRSGEKPGLTVDFNKYVKGQEFHGYKTVILDNLVQDASLMREPLSYLVYEAMGIAAPQIAHTRLTVNDQYWGVYTLVEDVTKPFLEARLGDKEGQLFKFEYDPYYFTYKGADAGAYVPLPFEPKTHEDHPDTVGLVAFISAVNQAPDATFVSEVSKYIDPARFLTYIATENAITENDGFVGYAGMNNFYVYQRTGTTKFEVIPWDKDNTFQMPSWPALQRMDENVLTRRLIADPQQLAVYLAALKQASGFVNSRWLGPQFESMYSLIRNAVLADTKKPNSNEDFENTVNSVRAIIAGREADILAQVP